MMRQWTHRNELIESCFGTGAQQPCRLQMTHLGSRAGLVQLLQGLQNVCSCQDMDSLSINSTISLQLWPSHIMKSRTAAAGNNASLMNSLSSWHRHCQSHV